MDLFVEASSPDIMAAMRCKADLGDLFDLEVDLIVGDGSEPIHRLSDRVRERLDSLRARLILSSAVVSFHYHQEETAGDIGYSLGSTSELDTQLEVSRKI